MPVSLDESRVDVCIVGGGPAGAMLALRLAQEGLRVTLLERSTSYQREFRGETLIAGAVQCLDEVGVLPRLRAHGYLEFQQLEFFDEGRRVLQVDFRRGRRRHKYPINLPQQAVLEALIEEARQHPLFECQMGAQVIELLEEGGEVRGVVWRRGGERHELRASLVVGADGRFSVVRQLSGLPFEKVPLPRVFVWFKMLLPEDWEPALRFYLHGARHLALAPSFPNHLQVGTNIPKGSLTLLRQQGIECFKQSVVELEPRLAGHIDQHVKSWADTSFLEIFLTRMPQWSRDGLVLIGDAAHTMSPAQGQGTNLAIMDARALSLTVARYLREHPGMGVPRSALLGFEAERQAHVRLSQRFQAQHERMLTIHSTLGVLLRRNLMRLRRWLPGGAKKMERITYFNLADTAPLAA